MLGLNNFFYVKTTVKVEGLCVTETKSAHSVATLQKIHQCHDNYLHLYKYNVLIFTPEIYISKWYCFLVYSKNVLIYDVKQTADTC